MNHLFEKLDNKINDLDLLKSVAQEQTAEMYRQAEKAVILCKQVLKQYESELLKRGFRVHSRFNTHYFEFSVSHKSFPTMEIAIANYDGRPVFYCKVDNYNTEIDNPKINPELTETVFTNWLDSKLNRTFAL